MTLGFPEPLPSLKLTAKEKSNTEAPPGLLNAEVADSAAKPTTVIVEGVIFHPYKWPKINGLKPGVKYHSTWQGFTKLLRKLVFWVQVEEIILPYCHALDPPALGPPGFQSQMKVFGIPWWWHLLAGGGGGKPPIRDIRTYLATSRKRGELNKYVTYFFWNKTKNPTRIWLNSG